MFTTWRPSEEFQERIVDPTAPAVPGISRCQVLCGTGEPEGVRTASIGALYLRTDAPLDTHPVWVKRSGTSTTTGWREWLGLRGAHVTSIAFPDSAEATESNAMAMGETAKAKAVNGLAWGPSAKVETGATNSIAGGSSAEAWSTNQTIWGKSAFGATSASGASAFGESASVRAARGLAAGSSADIWSSATDGVALGSSTSVSANRGVALGYSAEVRDNCDEGAALSPNTIVKAAYGVAAGSGSIVDISHTGALVEGRQAISKRAYQKMIGSAGFPIVDLSFNGSTTPAFDVATDGSVRSRATVAPPRRAVSAATTLTAADYALAVDASGGAITQPLPAAASVPNQIYVIRKVDSSGNAVTVDADGAETIDGATTVVLAAQWDRVTVQSNGTGWDRLA